MSSSHIDSNLILSNSLLGLSEDVVAYYPFKYSPNEAITGEPPLTNTNTTITENGIAVEEGTENIIPGKENMYPTIGNSHRTYNTNQYNSNVHYSIGTIESVVDNIVTLATVDHPIYTYDVLNPETTGGGVTAGTEYFIKKHSTNSFSLHAYNSSQDGSQGYMVGDMGFKVHESIWSDDRVPINSTDFPTMWHGNAHRPNSSMVKEIIPGGFKGVHDCIRCHSGFKEGANGDFMAYGVYPQVIAGEIYTFSFWYRGVTPEAIGTNIDLGLYTGAGWTGDGIPVTIEDYEWHKYSITCPAPNTGGTNLYFHKGSLATIDIARIQCEHKPYSTTFTDEIRGNGEIALKVGIGLSDFTIFGEWISNANSDSIDGYGGDLTNGSLSFSLESNNSPNILFRTYNNVPYLNGNDFDGTNHNIHVDFNTKPNTLIKYIFTRQGNTLWLRMISDDGQDKVWQLPNSPTTDIGVNDFTLDIFKINGSWGGIHRNIAIFNRVLSDEEILQLSINPISYSKEEVIL